MRSAIAQAADDGRSTGTPFEKTTGGRDAVGRVGAMKL
jgi:hypothetical protein